jgi:hypothetical protein
MIMPVHRARINQVIFGLLALSTVGVLFVFPPVGEVNGVYVGLLIIYTLLTAFAVYFAVVLPGEGEMNAAHTIGMVCLLSLPAGAFSGELWALAIGAAIGAMGLLLRSPVGLPHRRLSVLTMRSVVFLVARVTLSFFVASQVYMRMGGLLPLQRLESNVALPLTVFSVVYWVLYLALFLLENYAENHSTQRLITNSLPEIFITLTLPVPFALLIGELNYSRTPSGFVILLSGLSLTLWGQYSISRAQYRLRRQLDELKSLSVVSQVVSANLNLDSLLRIVYLQVAQLLDVKNFAVALYDRHGRNLTYPLTIRGGETVTGGLPPGGDRGGLLDHVLQTRQPLLIGSDVEGRARQMYLYPPAGNIHSWLGVLCSRAAACWGRCWSCRKNLTSTLSPKICAC